MSYTLIHNPRCSKSRQAKQILEDNGVEFKVREYLKEPLDSSELKDLFKKLEFDPSVTIRTNETIYKELSLGESALSQNEWIELLVKNPILLERPILVSSNKAIIGRPPENILLLI